MSKRLFALFAVLALALVATGCGGGGDSTSTASITKAEFLKQGNAICDKGNKEINAEFDTFAKKNNLQQGQNLTDDQATEAANTILIPSVQDQVDQIDELGAPDGEEAQVDAILAAARQGIDDLKQDPTLLAQSSSDPFAKANQLAKDYGLTACAG